MKKGSYLAGQKNSDYIIEQVLFAFAQGKSGQEVSVARRKPSRNTVYSLYSLVRRRLLDVGYYQSPEDFKATWMDDPELAAEFEFGVVAKRIILLSNQLKGASAESARYILADIIFRAQHPDMPPEAMFSDIKRLVKITGPLNRAPQNLTLWYACKAVIDLDRQIAALRQQYHPVSGANAKVIASLEKVRKEALRRFRRLDRAKSAHKNVRFR